MRAMRRSPRNRRWRTWRKRPVKVSSVVLILLATSCHKAEEEAAPAPLEVQVARAEKGDVSQIVEVAGELSALPGLDVKLGPLVSGRLAAVLVGEGDKVTE